MTKRFRRGVRLRRWAALGLATIGAALGAALPGHARAADSAVIFMYHRFGEDRYPSTDIKIEQFEAQLAEIAHGGYTVLPVADIADALQNGRSLPDRTLGLTVDDAYRSVLTVAWPRLKAAGLPLTLFVSTDAIDRGLPGFLSWDELRQLAEDGVTIGNHTASHPHLPDLTPEQVAAELAKSNARFQAELGHTPTVFAYPYGEYSLAVGKAVRAAGFKAAFGQHSGVMHTTSNFLYLPRFALNEAYGDLGRFKLTANALPIPVSDVTPMDRTLTAATNPPSFGFTVLGDAAKSLAGLRCYTSQEVKLDRLGARRVEVRMEHPFAPGRARINCTMPTDEGRWRWFGTQFYIKRN